MFQTLYILTSVDSTFQTELKYKEKSLLPVWNTDLWRAEHLSFGLFIYKFVWRLLCKGPRIDGFLHSGSSDHVAERVSQPECIVSGRLGWPSSQAEGCPFGGAHLRGIYWPLKLQPASLSSPRYLKAPPTWSLLQVELEHQTDKTSLLNSFKY